MWAAVSDPRDLVPAAVTAALFEQEGAAVVSCGSRWGWDVTVDVDQLTLRAVMAHPATGTRLVLLAEATNYRALPPAWRFVDDTDEVTPAAFPASGGSSIFHPQPVICAPWNRLAYHAYNGPHGDWDHRNWLNVTGCTRATTLPDMAAIIRTNLRQSPGMMA